MAEGGLGGVFNGIKWGIILNLAAVVLLPMATQFLGRAPNSGPQAGGGGHRPFGYGMYKGKHKRHGGGGGQDEEMGGRQKHHGGYGGMGWGDNW